MASVIRPDPFHWLLYAFGAGLPRRYSQWIFYDATAGTWLLRHLARSAVQILPFVVLLYFVVPGPSEVRLAAVLIGSAIGLFFALAFAWPAVGHRVVKAGYLEEDLEDARRARARARRERRYQR